MRCWRRLRHPVEHREIASTRSTGPSRSSHESGAFPVVIGGDHSIGYPDVRALAPHIEGKVGIIHLDRHIDIQERDMDERMHTTPWFHATNIPNAPPATWFRWASAAGTARDPE